MSRRVPVDQAATVEQVGAEISSLSAADTARITGYARKLVRGLGSATKGKNHEDLMQGAILSALSGNRRWNPAKVDFMGFLCGAMKSIASNCRSADRRSGGVEVLCDDRPTDEPGPNPLFNAETPVADPEREAIAKDHLARIERQFEADPLVKDVIGGFAAGMSGPEIMECTGASDKDYRAAVKRLRRAAKREGGS